MTRPAYHVDVATTALPQSIAQPPGGIQTAGFPAHSKFASPWANWLFNYLGAWTRELDQSCLRAVDFLSTDDPQLLQGSGSGFSLPEGAGLLNLIPNGGGAYVLFGRRVDLSADAVTDKYPTGFTLPNGSVLYGHAREETAGGGSSTGELLISTNASEVGYQAIWTGTTDATDLVSQSSLASAAVLWTEPVDVLTHLWITDPVNETALRVSAVNVTDPAVRVLSSLGGVAVRAEIGTSTGIGFLAPLAASNGTGFKATMAGSPVNASGFYVDADAGTVGAGFRVNHSGSGSGVLATAFGTGPAVAVVGSSSALSALTVTGGTSQAISASGQGAGVGLRAFSGSTAGTNAIAAQPLNATGFALQATTGSGATSAARAVRATATNSGSAIEASATGGYALIVSGDTTAPAFGEIHFTGQNADPTDVVDGSMQWNTTERQFKVSDATDIAWRGVWTSLGGFTHGHETTVTQSAIGNPVWNVAATAVCDGSNAPKVSGRQVILRFACEVRNNAAGVQNTLNVRLKSNGSVIVTRAGTGTGATAGYFLNGVSTDWQRSVVLVYAHTLSSGDHTFTAEIQSALGNTLIVRDASLTVDGLY